METKRIDFLTRTDHGRRFVPREVDLGALSPAARLVAEQILTTENADDFSRVLIESPLSERELLCRDWEVALAGRRRIDDFPIATLADYLARIERMYGAEYLDSHRRIHWTWDQLRADETPEAYLERHVAAMTKVGGFPHPEQG